MTSINNLLKYLLEQHKSSDKYVLFIDLDDVLAHFTAGIEANPLYLEQSAKLAQMTKDMFGKELSREELKPMLAGFQKEPQMRTLKRLFYSVEEQVYTSAKQEGFFANLKVMPGAKRMFEKATSMVSTDPKILTAPISNSLFCEPEKRQWATKHFGVPDSNIIVDQEKFKYAAPNHILIDDRRKNIDSWIAAGGIGILHTSPEDTIKQLKEILNGSIK